MADLLPPTTAMGGNNNRLLIGIAKLLEINTAGNPAEHGHKHTHVIHTLPAREVPASRSIKIDPSSPAWS